MVLKTRTSLTRQDHHVGVVLFNFFMASNTLNWFGCKLCIINLMVGQISLFVCFFVHLIVIIVHCELVE